MNSFFRHQIENMGVIKHLDENPHRILHILDCWLLNFMLFSGFSSTYKTSLPNFYKWMKNHGIPLMLLAYMSAAIFRYPY